MSAEQLYLSDELEVDWVSHTYRGRFGAIWEIVPSVTQALEETFLVDWSGLDPLMLAYAQERGSAVHFATRLYDENDLDESSLDPVVAPYLESYRMLLDLGFAVDPTRIERPAVHPIWRFGGTPDRGMFYHGDNVLIDLKATYALAPVTGVQLAGYALLELATRPELGPARRFGVQLRPSTPPRVVEYRDPGDTRVFMGALAACQWKRAHYGLPRI